MNLFLRERADLGDTPGEYHRDVEVADQWFQKALDAKKFKPSTEPRYAAPPPQARSLDIVIPLIQYATPPPPPPPPTAFQPIPPQRIPVGGNVQQANLIRKFEPIYSPLAQQPRIERHVRLTAIVWTDGRTITPPLPSGHPPPTT